MSSVIACTYPIHHKAGLFSLNIDLVYNYYFSSVEVYSSMKVLFMIVRLSHMCWFFIWIITVNWSVSIWICGQQMLQMCKCTIQQFYLSLILVSWSSCSDNFDSFQFLDIDMLLCKPIFVFHAINVYWFWLSLNEKVTYLLLADFKHIANYLLWCHLIELLPR